MRQSNFISFNGMMLSVIVPIYNEEKYIAQCLESILMQDYPKTELEVILVDGNSNDRTRKIINKYALCHAFIKVIDNPKRIVPVAMNLGIKASKGDVVMRLDAHTSYEKNYFTALVSGLSAYNADNIGAVCKTDVLNKDPKSLAIREVLSNKWGVGNSLFRIGIDSVQEVDTVPFGCWKRSAFEKYGYFDERLVRNQDIELNKRIKQRGGKIVIIPNTFCTYYAREDFGDLVRNNFKNGFWNILTVFFTGDIASLSVRHFVPLMFVIGLALPVIIGVWIPYIAYLSLFVLTSYLIALGSVSCKLAMDKKLSFFYLIASFTTLHLSYGCGSIAALTRLITLTNRKNQAT